MRRASRPLLVLAALASLAPLSSRALLAEDAPTLGRYVPAAVHFFGAWRAEENPWSKAAGRAMSRLGSSGIEEDFLELLTLEIGREGAAGVRREFHRALEILGRARWSELFAHETAVAFRLQLPVPEYAILCRVPEGAEKRHEELKSVFDGFAAYAPDTLYVSKVDRLGARVATLAAEGIPIALSAAQKKDVVILATSDLFLDNILRLMDSETPTGSIVEDARYVAGQKSLPAAGVGTSYFDLSGYFAFLQSSIALAGNMLDQAGESERALLKALIRVLRECGLLDAVVMNERVAQGRYFADSILTLKQRNDEPGFIEKLIAEQRSIRPFLAAVPRDAISFHVTAGIRPATVYDALMDTIAALPEGDDALSEWDHVQDEMGVRVRDDLLSWIDGATGWICLPPEHAGGAPELVVFLRVLDKEKAQGVFDGVRRPLEKHIRSRGHAIEWADVEGLDSFHELRIESLPWLRPVFGTPGDVLVFATSRRAARAVALTVSGGAPGIAENPRFRALGVPEGDLCDVFFVDVERQLTAVADALGTAGFVLSLLPEDRETRAPIVVGRIVSKLALALRELDVDVDYAGWTSYDRETHSLRGRAMATSREAVKGEF